MDDADGRKTEEMFDDAILHGLLLASEQAAKGTFDVRRAWRQTEKTLRTMNDAQRKQTLVEAGIMAKGGQIAKP